MANTLIGKRVRIPVHYDAWMRGARYGEITAYRNGRPGQSDYYVVRTDSGLRVRVWRLDWDYLEVV